MPRHRERQSTAGRPLAFLAVGHYLVTSDPLQPARAAVVFGGHLPFGHLEAAEIYHKGLVPEVWITRDFLHNEDKTLAQLGVHVVSSEEYGRQVLEHLGVPSAAIRVLDQPVDNTAEEVGVIAREIRRVGGSRIILITARSHTRRVRVLWRKLAGNNPEAIIRYTSRDGYDPDRWWRNSREALGVTREVFGPLNAWAGFPLKPAR